MRSIITFTLFCVLSFYCLGQDLSVTFTASGAATTIDSVTALNQRTNQAVTLPGNATLLLRKVSGMSDVPELGNRIVVFPNPFPGESRLIITLERPQKVHLSILNMIGQVVVQSNELLQPGANEFAFSVEANGIYFIVLETDVGIETFKAISVETSGKANKIHFNGLTGGVQTTSNSSGAKSLHSGYSLDYSDGDIIHYTCYSGNMITIMTDNPDSSIDYDVEFAWCTDPDGKHYKIVRIGEQTWMAENLAYLPSVSPDSSGSDSSPYYYVYEYEGSSVSAAKGTSNYTTYGVLYNWEAAKTACPTGWHLPSDEEWKNLEKYLGMSESDANDTGIRFSGDVGKKLKSTIGWTSNGNGDNSSGFNAVPGGSHNSKWGFLGLGYYADFWSSTEDGSSYAGYRYLDYANDAVYRYYDYRRYGFSVRCQKNE